MNYDFSKIREDGVKAQDRFKREIVSLRTGRANPIMVENLLVDSYGTKTPLKHLASISVDDPRTLRISPWDVSSLKSIESAIVASNLGAQPIADKQSVRVTLPSLTEENKKSMIKIIFAELEKTKISLRQSRDHVWKDIQEKEKAGEIPEDFKFRFKDELQKIIDKIIADLEEIAAKKEQEVSN